MCDYNLHDQTSIQYSLFYQNWQHFVVDDMNALKQSMNHMKEKIHGKVDRLTARFTQIGTYQSSN